jgi:hypothetical protein
MSNVTKLDPNACAPDPDKELTISIRTADGCFVGVASFAAGFGNKPIRQLIAIFARTAVEDIRPFDITEWNAERRMMKVVMKPR